MTFIMTSAASKRGQQGKMNPYFGPSRDQQHQADHAFLQHHDEQVDTALAQPGGRLRGVAWRRAGNKKRLKSTKTIVCYRLKIDQKLESKCPN